MIDDSAFDRQHLQLCHDAAIGGKSAGLAAGGEHTMAGHHNRTGIAPKRLADIAALAALQRRLALRAAELTKPGGILVYCSCSLEPEEGIEIVRDLLDQGPRLARRPISAGEVFGHSEWLTGDGDLRTLPCHLSDPDSRMAGLDGFYAARLQRI